MGKSKGLKPLPPQTLNKSGSTTEMNDCLDFVLILPVFCSLIFIFFIVFSSQGKRIFFVTNNSSKSRAQYLKKFEKFGIEARKVRSIFVYLDFPEFQLLDLSR